MSCRVKREPDCTSSRHGVVTRALFGLACAVSMGSCSLDTRFPALASTEAGGSADGGASDNPARAGANNAAGAGSDSNLGDAGAGASVAGSSAQAGQSGSVQPMVDGCADLNMNQVADCKESLVSNPDMNKNVDNWLADPDTTVDWNSGNAWGDTPSGSALVASPGVIDENAVGAALRAAAQCVPVTGKKLITVYANAFVDSGQDPEGHAEVDVFFFNQPSCAGTSTSGFSTPQPLDAATDTWLTLKAGSVSNDSTQSLLVKLAISKPFHADSFHARFDNVLLRIDDAP